MTTEPSVLKRRPGRPLPAPDPLARRQPHRLTDMTAVGCILRTERAARGLTQADMAARLGISRQHLVALEHGAEGAAAGTVLRILAELGVVVLALPQTAMADLASALAPPAAPP
jgi:DNA-binding XRE family transcriptional regulator